MPGIGESNYADNNYYQWYREMLAKSHCVVYLLRADQRDYAVDEVLFHEMFNSQKEKEKVIIALNYADKIEPINRVSGLSQMQILNLNQKVEDVCKLFNISKEKVFYYSATELINMTTLVNRIAKTLKQNTFR